MSATLAQGGPTHELDPRMLTGSNGFGSTANTCKPRVLLASTASPSRLSTKSQPGSVEATRAHAFKIPKGSIRAHNPGKACCRTEVLSLRNKSMDRHAYDDGYS